MISFIKSLFHRHDVIYTSRTFVGRGKKVLNSIGYIDIEYTNIYLVEGCCIKCGKAFKGKQEVLDIFDIKQPYDKEVPND